MLSINSLRKDTALRLKSVNTIVIHSHSLFTKLAASGL